MASLRYYFFVPFISASDVREAVSSFFNEPQVRDELPCEFTRYVLPGIKYLFSSFFYTHPCFAKERRLLR